MQSTQIDGEIVWRRVKIISGGKKKSKKLAEQVDVVYVDSGEVLYGADCLVTLRWLPKELAEIKSCQFINVRLLEKSEVVDVKKFKIYLERLLRKDRFEKLMHLFAPPYGLAWPVQWVVPIQGSHLGAQRMTHESG